MKRIRWLKRFEIGTENGEPVFDLQPRRIDCQDSGFAKDYAMAVSEAYNGEVTVEDIPDEPQEPTQLDRVEAQVAYTAMMTDTLLEV